MLCSGLDTVMSDDEDHIPATREHALPDPPAPAGRFGTMRLSDAQLRGEEPVPLRRDLPDTPEEASFVEDEETTAVLPFEPLQDEATQPNAFPPPEPPEVDPYDEPTLIEPPDGA